MTFLSRFGFLFLLGVSIVLANTNPLLAQPLPFNSSGKSAKDLRQLANVVAKKIANDIPHEPGKRYQVAVFPFADKNNKAPASMGALPNQMQGELIEALKRAENKGTYQVLSVKTLDVFMKNSKSSPTALMTGEPSIIRMFLDEVGIDYAVIGRFQFAGDKLQKLMVKDAGKEVGVFVRLYPKRRDGKVQEYHANLDKSDLLVTTTPGPLNPPVTGNSPKEQKSFRPNLSAANRFRVNILDEAGQPLPLKVCNNPDSEFHNCFFLILDREKYKNTPYNIQIQNLGQPAVGYKNGRPGYDEKRLFQVAVLVDGVNTIWELKSEYQPRTNAKLPEDAYEPVVQHPWYGSKWVLTPPKTKLVLDSQGQEDIKGSKLVPTSNPMEDGSVVTLPGFQVSEDLARKFLFAPDPSESLPFTRGLFTNDLGIIEVHFYAQQYSQQDNPQDWLANLLKKTSTKSVALGGPRNQASTKLGEVQKNETFHTEFAVWETPVQVWRIFYRYEDQVGGSLPVAPGDLVPVPKH